LFFYKFVVFFLPFLTSTFTVPVDISRCELGG